MIVITYLKCHFKSETVADGCDSLKALEKEDSVRESLLPQ
jgi:hypothetical protein